MKYDNEILNSPIKNLSLNELLEVYKKYHNEVNDFIDKSLEFICNVKKSSIKSKSIYLQLDSDLGSCYVRSGFDKFSKFGHPCFCISNIYFNEEFQSNGIFKVISAIITTLCLKNQWIFYVENPLEEKLQKFLKKSGFKNNDIHTVGNYFFMLPKDILISENELYSLEKSMNF